MDEVFFILFDTFTGFVKWRARKEREDVVN